jgi:IclR family pca regulon transcriptional regulator
LNEIIVANGLPGEDEGKPRRADLYVEAFAKGLAVIRAFDTQHRTLTLSEVAARAGVTPAGARRLLHTLIALGYAQVEGRSFSLLPAVLEIGHSYMASLSIRELATPLLEAFAQEFEESCTLSILDRRDVVYIARAERHSPVSRRIRVGDRLPAHATSSGHMLLAALPEPALADYLQGAPFERLTKCTVTEAAPLRALVELARTQDYAIANEQLELGVCGLAVPVRSRAGKTIAVLTTSLSLTRHDADSIAARFVPALQQCAAHIRTGLAE